MEIIQYLVTTIGLAASLIGIAQFFLKTKNNIDVDFNFIPNKNHKRVVVNFDKKNIENEGTFEYQINQFRLRRLKYTFGFEEEGWLFIYNPYGTCYMVKPIMLL